MTLEQAIDKLIELGKEMAAAERPIIFMMTHAIDFGTALQVIITFAIAKITGGDDKVMSPASPEREAELYDAMVACVNATRKGTDPVAEPMPVAAAREKVGVFPWIFVVEMAFAILKRIWENRQDD